MPPLCASGSTRIRAFRASRVCGEPSSWRPLAQVQLHDEHGQFVARPDFYYPEQRLALEYDGASHRDSLAADNRRQNRLMDAGYRLLRFTAADVLSCPESVVALVGRALARGPNLSA